MAKRIATVSGTALVPGVSKNGRLYSKEAIARAVQRAQERIAEGSQPLTMLTHHAADDDSLRVVGAVRSMTLAEDGSARFVADLADTEHARSILSLVSGDAPYLRGVSIRGAWVGKVRRERGPNGDMVETGDLELDGLDFTRKPGVPGAGIDSIEVAGGKPRETDDGRTLIYESAEALVTIIEDAETSGPVERAPVVPEDVREALRATLGTRPSLVIEADTPALSKRGSGLSGAGKVWADPGYQADKKQRYDLSSKATAKSAWSYINQADNAKAYTPNQLKRIKGRIVKALKRFGVTVAAEGWTIDPAFLVTEAVAEYYGDPDMCGSYSLSASNGPTNICVSGYGLDPADLEEILRAACEGACRALAALDPDMDGDVDVPGADAEDTDDDMGSGDGDDDDKPTLAQRLLAAALGGESAPDEDTEAVTETAPQDPAPVEAAANPTEQEESAMAEPTNKETAVTQAPVAENTQTPASAGTVTLTNEQFQQLLAAVRPAQAAAAPAPAPVAAESAPPPAQAAQETAPAAPAAPAAAAAPVTETTEQMMARLLAEQERKFEERLAAARTQAVQEAVENGGLPSRKGLVQPVNEHRAPSPEPAGDVGLNDYGVPSDWPDKPLHEYTNAERERYFGPAVVRHALGARADL